MKAAEIIKGLLREKRMKKCDLCGAINCSPQSLSQKLANHSMRADDYLAMCKAIGVEIKYFDKESGKELKRYKYLKAKASGDGRRVRRMVDGVIYDTQRAVAVSNNFYQDGENKYNDGRARELYLDGDKYFFAEYTEKEGERDRINPVSKADAEAFIEEHGDIVYHDEAD